MLFVFGSVSAPLGPTRTPQTKEEDMAQSKSLKSAVKAEVKEASAEAKTGNVKTTKAPADLPTGQRRSHPA
jgi:hypothetical protein